ncbi:hypothetical protein ZWY2020_034444 [Hordeum vulgare]|nr:hypothetical protein ZWY2020_034444 [Hordeum vulgare]
MILSQTMAIDTTRTSVDQCLLASSPVLPAAERFFDPAGQQSTTGCFAGAGWRYGNVASVVQKYRSSTSAPSTAAPRLPNPRQLRQWLLKPNSTRTACTGSLRVWADARTYAAVHDTSQPFTFLNFRFPLYAVLASSAPGLRDHVARRRTQSSSRRRPRVQQHTYCVRGPSARLSPSAGGRHGDGGGGSGAFATHAARQETPTSSTRQSWCGSGHRSRRAAAQRAAVVFSAGRSWTRAVITQLPSHAALRRRARNAMRAYRHALDEGLGTASISWGSARFRLGFIGNVQQQTLVLYDVAGGLWSPTAMVC